MTAKIKLNAASGGGSFSLQAPSSSSNDRVMTLPDTADGTILTTTNPKAGNIIQVVSTTKTDDFSTTSTSFTDITGLSVAITPSSTSNKILVFMSVDASNTVASRSVIVGLFRGSTNLLGSAANNRKRGFQLANFGDVNVGESIGFQFLDSPSTTSETTYKVQIAAQADTAVVNRSGSDANNAGYGYRSASSITVMEVAV
jgi:hypothetical protein